MVLGAGSVCATLARKGTGQRDGEKEKAEVHTHQNELLWVLEMAWNPQRHRWPA